LRIAIGVNSQIHAVLLLCGFATLRETVRWISEIPKGRGAVPAKSQSRKVAKKQCGVNL